ncbi:hypothetical protein, partial [Jutongia sp.]|uniref:hypothetical protein n=1 Tax=Jutongia sp. TaxID=2944204 RepID=UPI003080751E
SRGHSFCIHRYDLFFHVLLQGKQAKAGIAWEMKLMAGISEMRLKNYFGSSFLLPKTRTGG